mmetsp:Transcript_15378/g.38154  ORF Transcript_15378/g.38154 Transcript_15378/m.38154 type:complete len:100 (+) Transcript_15378:5464-5763(+)
MNIIILILLRHRSLLQGMVSMTEEDLVCLSFFWHVQTQKDRRRIVLWNNSSFLGRFASDFFGGSISSWCVTLTISYAKLTMSLRYWDQYEAIVFSTRLQ